MTHTRIDELVAQAYAEDLPSGDVTTEALKLPPTLGNAKLIAKEDIVLSGKDVFEACICHMSPQSEVRWQFHEGDLLLKNQVVAWLRGDLRELLKAERVALNFLGRLSGIATLTRCFVQETKGTTCKILDTRKTTPLFRGLEKRAVVAGGGHNHRMNLSSAILIKDNHIRAMGSLRAAVQAVASSTALPIEVECRTLAEVEDAVKLRVHRILLDNMSTEDMRSALKGIPSVIETEASGNMTIERIRPVAQLGVTYISVGALTHSAPCADFSLMFEWPHGNS